MQLVLIRHGHDLPSPGGQNALSRQGRAAVAATATRLKTQGIDSFDVAFCSTAQRAVQSLEEIDRIVPSTTIEPTLRLCDGEQSEHIDSIVVESTKAKRSRILIVGHEPQLSNAVLRWCRLPVNPTKPTDMPPWIISRGDGIVVSPKVSNKVVELSFSLIQFLHRKRPLPRLQSRHKVGVF